MKKVQIIIIITLLFVSFNLTAQDILNLGIKGGYTSNKVTVNISDIEEGLTESFHFGAFTRLNIKRIFLQPECYYVTKGGLLTETIDELPIVSTFSVKCIDIPILLGYKLIDLDAVNLRIFAGPVASIVVGSYFELSNTFESITAESINEAIWGVQVGAGIDIFMFSLDLRAESGITEISRNSPDFDLHHNTVNISLGWKIF